MYDYHRQRSRVCLETIFYAESTSERKLGKFSDNVPHIIIGCSDAQMMIIIITTHNYEIIIMAFRANNIKCIV